jgi:hypothetical protein
VIPGFARSRGFAFCGSKIFGLVQRVPGASRSLTALRLGEIALGRPARGLRNEPKKLPLFESQIQLQLQLTFGRPKALRIEASCNCN